LSLQRVGGGPAAPWDLGGRAKGGGRYGDIGMFAVGTAIVDFGFVERPSDVRLA
jgi:hypothetical protein